jgi:hypothetical protein
MHLFAGFSETVNSAMNEHIFERRNFSTTKEGSELLSNILAYKKKVQ